jgi:uncharacterized SAM-binding protein YcdF (DUF218 family)
MVGSLLGKRRTALLRLGAGAAVVLALAGFFFARPLLCVERGRHAGDIIVVLTGEMGERPFRALELYKSGAAPGILVSGRDREDLFRDRLVLAGVPREVVSIEPYSRNTKENAEFSTTMLRAAGCKRVVLVTSWYHSRRALACFRHFAKDIEISSCPAYHNAKMSHAPELSEAIPVFREYLAIAWYLVRYGISPNG